MDMHVYVVVIFFFFSGNFDFSSISTVGLAYITIP